MGDNETWYEEFKVTGDSLLTKVKELVAEGDVRRVFVRSDSGKTLLEIPLNAGIAVTAVSAILAPWLVAIGAIAALATSVTIGVERTGKPPVVTTTVVTEPGTTSAE